MADKFSCSFCNKDYNYKRSLNLHIKKCHGEEHLLSTDAQLKLTIKCKECNALFRSKSAMYRHVKRTHVPSPSRKEIQMEFHNIDDFMKWKLGEEEKTFVHYVKHHKDNTNKNGVVHRRFFCHRSGNFVSRSGGVRTLKVQGSAKINAVCPSRISTKIHLNGKVTVMYYPNHEGHQCEVAHLNLRKEDRQQIAGMLAAGITFEDVLNKIQSSCDNQEVSRRHLITRKDIENVAHEFNVSQGERLHRNDVDSVAAWIEYHRQEEGEDCIVRYIKFQGEIDKEHGLQDDDFMLIIITKAQIAALQKFCIPLSQVSMDSTHGTNEYQFHLSTIMTIDEHGEGFPGAFCFSSKIDESSIKVFLHYCKLAVGRALNDVILMTDGAEAFNNAWNVVMGPPAHHLLCCWHVDRAWRKNINSKLKGDSLLKATVYKTLRSLMQMPDKVNFLVMLQKFVATAKEDPNTSDFGAYFEREYAHRPQLWAYSYRLGLRVHHNMHLEAYHRVLKHVHLQGRKVRRLDKCIHGLMRSINAKMNDRLLKLHKGKWTRYAAGIRKRHKISLSMNVSKVTCIRENMSYIVQGPHDFYMVEQSDSLPHSSVMCAQVCRDCNVCVHTFVCSCLDAGLRNTVCKHVHLVIRACKPKIFIQAAASQTDNRSVVNEADNLIQTAVLDPAASDETQIILESLRPTNPANDLAKYVEAIQQNCNFLCAAANSDVGLAASICKQLAHIRANVCAQQNKPSIPRLPQSTSCEPANKRITPQRRFLNTKNKAGKRKRETILSKPTNSESVHMLAALGGDVEVVSHNLANTDHDYDVTVADVINFEHSYHS